MKQQTLAMGDDQTLQNYRKLTRRDELLNTMVPTLRGQRCAKSSNLTSPRSARGGRPLAWEAEHDRHAGSEQRPDVSGECFTQPGQVHRLGLTHRGCYRRSSALAHGTPCERSGQK